MLVQLLLAAFLIINTTGESVGVSPSPPIQREVKSSLDGKILNLNGTWVVALSDRTIQVIRSDQIDRFKVLMAEWNNIIPPFAIYENFENFYPYSIQFSDSGESFHLVKELAALDLWVLTLGEGKTFALVSKEYPLIGVSEDRLWELSNPVAYWDEVDKWSIGDPLIIVPVFAESRHYKQMAGYLVFHGTDTDLLEGYWIQSLAN